VGYARLLGGLSVGMNGKFIQSTIVDSAQAFAVDFGLLTPPLLGEHMRLSFTAVNLGSKIKFDQASEDLPMAFRFGSAFKLSGHWSASADLAFPNDNKPYLAFGTELGLPLGDTVSMVGRMGYNSRSEVNNSEKMSGVALGFGLGFSKLSFDYGFLPFGSSGFVHRVSITRKF
jgi:hypothetical protein